MCICPSEHTQHSTLTRRLDLHQAAAHVGEWALAVDGLAEGVQHTTQVAGSDGHVHDLPGPVHQVALVDVRVRAEHHDTDVVRLQVQGHALDTAVEAHQLSGLCWVCGEESVNEQTPVCALMQPSQALHCLLACLLAP